VTFLSLNTATQEIHGIISSTAFKKVFKTVNKITNNDKKGFKKNIKTNLIIYRTDHVTFNKNFFFFFFLVFVVVVVFWPAVLF
jgi:hypothetical protein